MAFDFHKNLAYSTVATAPSPATSGTTLSVAAGHGTRFPAVPFNATVWPLNVIPDPSNGEIIRVTSKGAGDNWTIVRQAEVGGTAARSIVVGDQIAATITNKSLTDIESSVAAINVKQYGATGDGTTNDAAAIQAAIDALPATGGIVYFPRPAVNYLIGSTSLTIGTLGTRLVGEGSECAIIKYTGAGTAIKNSHATAMRSHVGIEDLFLDLSTASNGAIAIDFTCWSYSMFKRILIDIAGTNKIGFYGNANTLGSAPYYNKFDQCDVIGNNHLGSTTGSHGFRFDVFDNSGSFQGPNDTNVIGGRVAGLDTAFRIIGGNGNRFIGVGTEACTEYHYHFGTTTPHDTGTLTSATNATATDTGATWGTNIYINGAIRITGGTGSGQYRRIIANSGTVITLDFNWATVPDATSTYEIYPATAVENDILSPRIEGSASFNPHGLRLEASAHANRFNGGVVASLGSGLTISAPMWRWADVLRPGSWREVQAFTFTATDVAAGVTNQELTIGGSVLKYVMLPYNADIVGINVACSANRSAGTLTVKPSSEGTPKTLAAVLDASTINLQTATQPPGIENMGGISRRIGATVTTDGSWAPTTGDISVTVFLIPR